MEMLKTASLRVGESLPLNWTITPSNASGTVSFISSNPDVATVTSNLDYYFNGKIYAIKPGEATITLDGKPYHQQFVCMMKVRRSRLSYYRRWIMLSQNGILPLDAELAQVHQGFPHRLFSTAEHILI